jgi:hemoglobin/transferrin/lactoferrin receptor protein
MLQRTEIVYGPGSVVYGSDALGGVIHLFTKKPELSIDSNIYFTGNLYTRYATVNNEQSSHFDVNFGGKKFASLTSASIHVFGDLRQ